MQANVLDLSHHNRTGKIPDFKAVKDSGILACIFKCTEGYSFRDPVYSRWMTAAMDAGLLVGAYHFLTNLDGKAQAAFFYQQSLASSFPGLLMAVDYEPYSEKTPSLKILCEFITTVEDHIGRNNCVIYSGNLIRETLRPGNPLGDFFAAHRLWLAQYNPHGFRSPWPWALGPWLWQFTDKAHVAVDGLTGNVDGNIFDGSADDLAKDWAKNGRDTGTR
jgi:lysozyme